MENTAVRIEGTMTTTPKTQDIHVVSKKTPIPVQIEGRGVNVNAGISKERYNTFKALVRANGLTISIAVANLIDDYISNHVDEILALRNIRERL